MSKAAGIPVLISPEGNRHTLERVQLGAGLHDEEWLQELIFAHPALLPIAQIEPGFGTPLPAAREVACGHGYIDNLYLTPSGEIVLVETKLWRNVQARREVVAQALDYVAALMRLGFERFEAAVVQAGSSGASSLHSIVAHHPEALDEPAFVDAIARNLARGRMLVLVLGDGIRREAEALAELLQGHAGAHFTFALVELATWRNASTGDIVVLPTTLAQTTMIERGVLRIEGVMPVVEPVAPAAPASSKTLTEEMFYEQLAKRDPSLPNAIRHFLQLVDPLGVYAEFKASLNLKVDLPISERAANLGYIGKNGKLWTNPLSWTVPAELAMRYNQALANLIGGEVATHDNIYLTTNGTSAPLVNALLPRHAQGWADAIQQLIRSAAAQEAIAAA